MANYEIFSEKEIPYGILENFGLTHEMIDDLPQNVMQRFLAGRATPVLPIVTENTEGHKVKSLARISLVRMNDGTVDICFAPRWVDKNLSEFTNEQQEKLKLGSVATAVMPGKGSCYIQFDDTINQVMAVPVAVISHNIAILTRSFDLSDSNKNTLEDGGVVEMNIDDKTVSAGIDLNEMSGIRIANGDIIAWQQDATTDRLPKYNFGLFGCWMADDENILTYVAEEDYTQEILDEQKRVQTQNAAEAQLSQLKV